MHKYTDWLAFPSVRSESFSCLCPPTNPPALFSPGRWASGGLSEGFTWVGCPGGVQTLVQWMSRRCGGSVTRLQTDGNVQKGRRPLLSTLQGIDQPTRGENKHASVWVNTQPITGNVTQINKCKKKNNHPPYNTCRCLQQICF